MKSRRRLWICWLALVFGLLNIYGQPLESFLFKGNQTISMDELSQHTSFLDRILIDLRDDYSSRFYYSDRSSDAWTSLSTAHRASI